MPSRHEAALVVAYQMGKDRLDFVYQRFRHQFIQGITKPYRAKLADVIRLGNFRNED